MNNPFFYTPDNACREAFRKLLQFIVEMKMSNLPSDIAFCRELDAGKMLGVLIAEDLSGVRHELFAFSGQIGESGFYHAGFVEPVFDYLKPDEYFKIKEGDISRQNVLIAEFESKEVVPLKKEYEDIRGGLEAGLSVLKERYSRSKAERARLRECGDLCKGELADMIRQSQFEKAEIHRFKKRMAAVLEPFEDRLEMAVSQLDAMKERRRADSENLQKWLFENFKVLNARGENKSLGEIFEQTPLKVPPSGAGECCGPKLLQAAYKRGWLPLSIAEYWYGKPKGGEVRRHGHHYLACRGKCLPVLSWMLEGLEVNPPLSESMDPIVEAEPEVLFENKWFCVVNKPSGMLSVPGKGSSVSVQEWLSEKFGGGHEVMAAHRLDRDTSGLLVVAFDEEALRVMQKLFVTRKVKKTYVAELEGDYMFKGIERRGRIELPLSPDWLDRPRQRVDFDSGKESITEYEFMGVNKEGRSRVNFHPLTGRTHQLRVHSASEFGLGMSIVGDPLYGHTSGAAKFERLHLHAHKIEFTFPLDNRHYSFESPVPF